MSHARRGLTLVEVAVSTVLVGVMLVAALRTSAAVARSRKVGCDRTVAAALADEMTAAILALPYSDEDNWVGEFSPETGAWGAFDDIDDFHGLSQSPPQEADGTARADLPGWGLAVTVARVDPADLVSSLPGANDDSGVRTVTVTVTSAVGVTVTRHAVVTRDRLRSTVEPSQNF